MVRKTKEQRTRVVNAALDASVVADAMTVFIQDTRLPEEQRRRDFESGKEDLERAGQIQSWMAPIEQEELNQKARAGQRSVVRRLGFA